MRFTSSFLSLLYSSPESPIRYACRALFEKHKLLLSFQMCVKKMAADAKLNHDEYLFLLRGGLAPAHTKSANPSPDWISDNTWDQIVALDSAAPAFRKLATSVEQNPRAWKQWARAESPEIAALPGEWQTGVDDLQRMLLLRVFRPDRVVHSARKFVAKNLGPTFVEPPPMDLTQIYADSTPTSPVIFVLSTGVDPSSMLRQLAGQMNVAVEEISLGQGQEGPARRLLAAGVARGFWVFFANCHLSISWMSELESLIEAYCSGESPPHPAFRLWLSSDPVRTAISDRFFNRNNSIRNSLFLFCSEG
jgi:dynein heavy chain, axonemal